jgi:type II secretory pathway component PulM
MTDPSAERLRERLEQIAQIVETMEADAAMMREMLEEIDELVAACLNSSEPGMMNRLFARSLLIRQRFRAMNRTTDRSEVK